MGAQAKVAGTGRMTADEYLVWSEGAEGRWELVDGEVVAQAAERLTHVRVKSEAFVALRSAIRAQGLDCEAVADDAAVRIDPGTVFEPDALVRPSTTDLHCIVRMRLTLCDASHLIIAATTTPRLDYLLPLPLQTLAL